MSDTAATPTAFVSYSWDGEDHKAWVRGLAARLRGDGVDVALDQWELQPGDRLPAFMEAAVRDNDFVIIICTPHYKERSDARKGGVGYEGDIMTGELLTTGNERKFIPVLRRGDEAAAVPSWLAGKYYVDMREEADHERSYEDLLTTLLGRREAPPPLGSPSRPSARRRARGRVDDAGSSEPIRILGVIADEVSEPLGDGTRGSALYRIPLRLSRRPSAEWADLFERTWDHPPRYSTMHRPGILSVQGDRIVLDGTTVEELEHHHRETLMLVLEKVNSEIAGREAADRRRAEAESRRRDEHRRSVENAARRLSFDAPEATGEEGHSALPAASQYPAGSSWSIEGQATAIPSRGRDAAGFAWTLRRGEESRGIVVWISRSVMASSDAGLRPDIAEAKRSRGRSALSGLLEQRELPSEVVVASYGIDWEGMGARADEEDQPSGVSVSVESGTPDGNDTMTQGSHDVTRLSLLERLRDLILEGKDAAREALDAGASTTPRLINAGRRIQTIMKQLGDQEFPLGLANFAGNIQNATTAMSFWQAADAAVETMIVETTR